MDKIPDAARPFRLIDVTTEVHTPVRYRCYVSGLNAEWGCFKEMKFSEIGRIIHLVDIRNMKMLAEFKRVIEGIYFLETKHGKAVIRKEMD